MGTQPTPTERYAHVSTAHTMELLVTTPRRPRPTLLQKANPELPGEPQNMLATSRPCQRFEGRRFAGPMLDRVGTGNQHMRSSSNGCPVPSCPHARPVLTAVFPIIPGATATCMCCRYSANCCRFIESTSCALCSRGHMSVQSARVTLVACCVGSKMVDCAWL